MNVQTQIRPASTGSTEHFDVVIAGAGISGVGQRKLDAYGPAFLDRINRN